MSLVTYENSSDSEVEGAIETTSARITETPLIVDNDVDLQPASLGSDNIFMKLPEPKAQIIEVIPEVEDEFLLKKETPLVKKPKIPRLPIKIKIPALASYDSDEDEEPTPKKRRPQSRSKNSSLISLLPPPKQTIITNRSFLPNILSKKVTKKAPVIPRKKPEPKKEPQKKDGGPESDSDMEVEDLPEMFDDETWQKVCNQKKRVAKPRKRAEPQLPVIDVIEPAPEAAEPYSGLDNLAFKELVGKSKGRRENIKLIDINEEDVRPDREEWLKSLTDPNVIPKTDADADEEEEVNNTIKKKHHITYLAKQAKANEQDLKNQWAQSRMTRKQTQAKYGF